MIETLKGFDRTTAVGVLSRAALAMLSSEANPSAEPVIQAETELRRRLIEELAGRLGLPLDLSNSETRDRLSDALDQEAETLDGPIDAEAALRRLSERGVIPSDIFHVDIYPSVRELYGSTFTEE